MNTTRNTILIVLLFAAAAFIGGFLWKGNVDTDDEASPTPEVSVTASATPTAVVVTPKVSIKPVMHTVTVTSSGVSPASLTIRVGDAVRFVNKSGEEVWPASDPHPTHTLCPGFDARRGLKNGEEYTLTFPLARTCTYHSHLDPSNSSLQGTITVQ